MNRKIFLILVFSLATLYTVYNIYDTYALLETDEIVSNDIKTAKWNIKINDTLLGNTTSFVVDGIKIEENDYTKENKLAPGTSGYFDILIDPTDTDVSIKYAISFDFSNVPEGIDVLGVSETSGDTLIKTGENTYTNVLTLNDIKTGIKNNIRVNFSWNNIETNNIEDSKLGLIYNNKIEIPVEIEVLQYLGEEIKEYR